MKKFIISFPLLLIFTLISSAQLSRQAQDSIRKITQEDYNNMLEQVGISSTRPGPSGELPDNQIPQILMN